MYGSHAIKNNETSTENNAYQKNYPQKVADDERKWPSVITIPKDRITTSQAVVIIVNYILGTGILTLPRASVEKSENTRCMVKCDIRWDTGNGFRSNYGQIKSAVSRKNILPIQSRYCREMDREIA